MSITTDCQEQGEPRHPGQRDSRAGVVFVIGEALIDIVERTEGVIEYAGGSPMNVACGLARLGLVTVLRTSLGRDDRGQVVIDHVSSSGVTLAEESLAYPKTSTARASIDTDGKAEYDFDITWAPGPIQPPSNATVIHTGSIAATLQPGADDVLATFRQVSSTVLRTFDPNVRPGVTPHHEDVKARVLSFAGLADVVKMSDDDAAWLHPGVPLQGVIDLYLASGSRLVAITRGQAGCLMSTGGLDLTFPAPEVKVADTIGAGDSFMSAMIFAIVSGGFVQSVQQQNLSAEDLATIATAALDAARITVSRAGANPPHLHELRRS